MKKVKKFTAGLLSGIMALSALGVVPLTASAAKTSYEVSETSGNYEYELLDDGTAAITGYYGYPTTVIFPSTLDGYKVTAIADYAFEDNARLKNVTIPNSITDIGDCAFEYCENLESVTIPGSVTNIGDYAFEYCENLESVTIGEGVESIGYESFYGCTNLENITIPDSVTSIDFGAFDGTAWYDNQSEDMVYAGKVLYKYVGSAKELTSVVVKNGTKSITWRAFSYCESIASITIPDSITSNGNAFANCNIDEIIIADGSKQITGEMIVSESVEKVVIPNSVTCISNWAFSYCKNLTSITIPDSVTSIGDYAFAWCDSLTNITIPDSVASIGNYAFYDCANLDNVDIPNSVTHIGDHAFEFNSTYKIYFDVAASGWNNVRTVYCHIWRADGTGTWTQWQTKVEKCDYDSDTGIATYDLSKTGNTISPTDGNLYCVIFSANTGMQTYSTIMSGACIGDTLYCNGTQIENPVDSERASWVAVWVNNTDCGPLKTITSTGNIVGTTYAEGATDTTLLADYLISYYNNTAKTDLTQDLIDTLELNVNDVQTAVDEKLAATKNADASEISAAVKEILSRCSSSSSSSSSTKPTEATTATVPTSATKDTTATVPSSSTEPTEATTATVPTSATEPSKTNPTTPTEPTTKPTTAPATEPAETYILGDVNEDGVVDISDATAIQKAVAKITELTETQQKAADVNGDGTIDITDATMIQKFVAKIITEFTAAK